MQGKDPLSLLESRPLCPDPGQTELQTGRKTMRPLTAPEPGRVLQCPTSGVERGGSHLSPGVHSACLLLVSHAGVAQ